MSDKPPQGQMDSPRKATRLRMRIEANQRILSLYDSPFPDSGERRRRRELRDAIADLERLRVKVAELCGWRPERRKLYAGVKNVHGWGKNTHLRLGDKDRFFTMTPRLFPDFCNDLNACSEFEKMLSHENLKRYNDELERLTNDGCIRISVHHYAWHAPATQRCLAFVALHEGTK